MVSLAALLDAQPQLWQRAADDLVLLAKEAEQARSSIYDQGVDALRANWADDVGQRAAGRLTELAESYGVLAATVRGAVSVLDGLSEAAEVTRRDLQALLAAAARDGMEVAGDGSVRSLGIIDDPMVATYAARISATLARATSIDDQACAALTAVVAGFGGHDVERAVNETQAAAAVDQLGIIRASVPTGRDPAEVAAWWSALTPLEQDALEKAVPVQLFDLDGIPQEVKQGLVGSGGYSRVELVRWAEQNWDDPATDLYENNCANFVSNALEQAGLQEKMSPLNLLPGSDDWGHDDPTGITWLDQRTHSRSWSLAAGQRQFLVEHGGQELPIAQARPGDIIYFEQVGQGGPQPVGNTQHAAIVTAVTPDGDIHYTQHSDPRLDVSLNGRMPDYQIQKGTQKVVVVRPNADWYAH